MVIMSLGGHERTNGCKKKTDRRSASLIISVCILNRGGSDVHITEVRAKRCIVNYVGHEAS